MRSMLMFNSAIIAVTASLVLQPKPRRDQHDPAETDPTVEESAPPTDLPSSTAAQPDEQAEETSPSPLDEVDEASDGSFPASDPPGWIPMRS